MAGRLGKWARRAIRRLRPQPPVELIAIPDREAGPGRDQVIPRVVLQTAESSSVHPSHAKSIDAFRSTNPDLAFQLFDREARDRYMATSWGDHPIFDIYSRSVFGQMKADIFRYCIVWERGGYYFDFNKGCTVPLTSLHAADSEGLVSYESTPEMLFPDPHLARTMSNPFNLVLQWGFGFRAGHQFLQDVIDRIVEIEPFFRGRVFAEPKKALLTMSAPGVFTDVFRRYVAEHGSDGITEAGVDFNGAGVFRLPGSKKMLSGQVYYGAQTSKHIVMAPEDQDGRVL